MRAFEAQFDQDYEERNAYYAQKLAQTKITNQQDLNAETEFVQRGIMDQAVYKRIVQTERGDSILPQGRLAKNLFPDPFANNNGDAAKNTE